MAKRPFSTPFSTILTARLARRAFLKGSLAATVASVFPLAGCATPTARSMPMGFTAIPASSDDALKVPPEYDATVLFRWGDPVGVAGNMPAFRPDASNSAADQAVQAGMHHDGMWFHPLPYGTDRRLTVCSRSITNISTMACCTPTACGPGAPRKCARPGRHGVAVIEVRLSRRW